MKPLAEILHDCAFLRLVGKGNYPLQEIFGAKACVLQDVRISTFKLDFDSLLVWFEGEKFYVPFPRNRFEKDRLYTERAPVFISSGSKFRIPHEEATRLQVNEEEQNRMMDSLFMYFHFQRSLAKEEKMEVAPCARCFAQWVCAHGAAGGSAGGSAAGPQVAAAVPPLRPAATAESPVASPFAPQDAAEAIMERGRAR